MERVRDRAGGSTQRSARPGPPRSVSGVALKESLHTEGQRETKTVGNRGAGGQDCPKRCGHGPQSDIRGRCCHWVPARTRSREISQRFTGTTPQVWAGAERRQDPADPVRALRPAEPGRTWGRETGVVHLSGLQTHMCGEQSGAIRSPAHYRRRPAAEETAKHQAGTPSQEARPGGAGRRMAEERAQRLLPIPCSPGEPDGAETIPATGRPLMVPCAGTAQPKAAHLGETGETIRSLATRSTCC